MTEQDHRVCPRCGQEAGEYHFCPSCLAPIDALSGIPAHARVSAEGPSETLATETAATAVQVETAPRSAEDTAATPGPELPLRADARLAAQPPRDVARFEDVLTVAPSSAGKVAAVIASEISLRSTHSSQPPAAVARLEDVLTVAPTVNALRPVSVPPPAPAPASAPEPSPDPPEAPASVPPPLAAEAAPGEVEVPSGVELAGMDVPAAVEVAAQSLREAFWFEQASASKADAHRVSIPPPAPAPAPEAMAVEAVSRNQVVAPAELPLAETVTNQWAIAAFLVALLALVVALTGRRRAAN